MTVARRLQVGPRLVAAGRVAGRRWWVTVAVVVLLVAGLTWAFWRPDRAAAPRARQYVEFTGCLLTDSRGLGGAEAAQVWAGMQDASAATRARVEYLSVAGPQTRDNALTYLASLAQGRCGLVFAVGDGPVGAVAAGAQRFAGTRFVVPGAGPAGSNVVVLQATGGALRADAAQVLADAVRAAGVR